MGSGQSHHSTGRSNSSNSTAIVAAAQGPSAPPAGANFASGIGGVHVSYAVDRLIGNAMGPPIMLFANTAYDGNALAPIKYSILTVSQAKNIGTRIWGMAETSTSPFLQSAIYANGTNPLGLTGAQSLGWWPNEWNPAGFLAAYPAVDEVLSSSIPMEFYLIPTPTALAAMRAQGAPAINFSNTATNEFFLVAVEGCCGCATGQVVGPFNGALSAETGTTLQKVRGGCIDDLSPASVDAIGNVGGNGGPGIFSFAQVPDVSCTAYQPQWAYVGQPLQIRCNGTAVGISADSAALLVVGPTGGDGGQFPPGLTQCCPDGFVAGGTSACQPYAPTPISGSGVNGVYFDTTSQQLTALPGIAALPAASFASAGVVHVVVPSGAIGRDACWIADEVRSAMNDGAPSAALQQIYIDALQSQTSCKTLVGQGSTLWTPFIHSGPTPPPGPTTPGQPNQPLVIQPTQPPLIIQPNQPYPPVQPATSSGRSRVYLIIGIIVLLAIIGVAYMRREGAASQSSA